MSKEKGILFSAPMVRAILENRKTQTRRTVNPQPIFQPGYMEGRLEHAASLIWPKGDQTQKPGDLPPPYGWNIASELGKIWAPFPVGTRAYVKETFGLWCHSIESVGVEYAAGGEDKIVDFPNKVGMPSLEVQCQKNKGGGRRKCPSIFMPKWASRIWLNVTAVRVERLQDITEEDAKAEGIRFHESSKVFGELGMCFGTAKRAYKFLWESINGPGSWDLNPWVWVYQFRRIDK